MQAELTDKESAYATHGQTLTNSRQTMEDTKKQLKNDEAFVADTDKACKDKAAKWTDRSRLRAEELKGIDEALGYLQSDEAKRLLGGGVALLQDVSRHRSGNKVAMHLQRSAAVLNAPRLHLLSDKTKHGSFQQVLEAINEMIGICRKEETEDIRHKDWCDEERADKADELDRTNHTHQKKLQELADKEIEGTNVESLMNATDTVPTTHTDGQDKDVRLSF
uniref:Uncharacterized protein n=1 Tax=Vitrella brassicaformis TaxID=1169539 RepID=A0A7S1JZK8_9ALVE